MAPRRRILLHPDPRLKQVAVPVSAVTLGLALLAKGMLKTMYHARGIGLAAPQIGVSKRLIVMDCAKARGGVPCPMVLINPEVLWASKTRAVHREGCLSIPRHFAYIERPAEVRVRWLGLDGKLHEEKFTGLWATCVQHEIDHLNGKLFIDHLTPMLV